MNTTCISCGCDRTDDDTPCPWCGLGCITGTHDAFVAFCEAAHADYASSRRRIWAIRVTVVVGLVAACVLGCAIVDLVGGLL